MIGVLSVVKKLSRSEKPPVRHGLGWMSFVVR
jgi:hypothetical protein